MYLTIQDMDENLAIESLQWEYSPPYDFYNVEVNPENIAERLDGTYQAVFKVDIFIGFFCMGSSAQVPAGHAVGAYEEDCVDIGLGMDPNLVGQGNGYEFGSAILEYIQEHYGRKPIRLSVATFNERAVRLYENLGFVKTDTFRNDNHEFITMINEA